jgi:hypothetical protein
MGKVKTLPALLVILAVSMPATITLVAMGIEPTTAPVGPQVQAELIEEQVTSEAPADEAPPVEPEAVDLESPDPVAPVEEVKTEDPVVPEPEEPATRAGDPPGDPMTISIPRAENNLVLWEVDFNLAWEIWQYDVTISVQDNTDPKNPVWVDLVTYSDGTGPKGPFYDDPIDFVVPKPPTSLPSQTEYLYWIWVDSLNQGPHSDDLKYSIGIDWWPSPQDIEVTMTTVDPYNPPIVTISNVGELPLTITDVSVDNTYYGPLAEVIAGGDSITLTEMGIVLPGDVGMHSILITSDDPDEPNVPLAYAILAPPEPTLTVVAADFAAGIGSERFGVTVDCNPEGKDVIVNVVLEAMSDGDDLSPVESIAITEETTVKIIVKTLFEDENGDEAVPGALYQYRVWMTVDGVDEDPILIENVGLWHWSTFTGLRSVTGAWEAEVAWDTIQVQSLAGFSVYVALRKWDGETLWDITDSGGNQVVVSQEVEGIAAGEATLLLDKPDQKVVGDEVVGGETWMAGLGSGYYFFTFMAENDAVDPWAERIGCPPEAL